MRYAVRYSLHLYDIYEKSDFFFFSFHFMFKLLAIFMLMIAIALIELINAAENCLLNILELLIILQVKLLFYQLNFSLSTQVPFSPDQAVRR